MRILTPAILLAFLLLTGFQERSVRDHDTGKDKDTLIHYSPASRFIPKMLFDYYHHSGPTTKVGNLLVTGNWIDNGGRYGWDDFVHTNSFDPVFTALEKEYAISMSKQPFSKSLLQQTDIVVLTNPDNPELVPSAKVLTDREIELLDKFVTNGGSLMVIINSGGEGREHEEFEDVQLRKLIRHFGLDWNSDDTHYSNNVIGTGHPYFYDVPVFHYGAGCTLQVLPGAAKPEVLLNVYSDEGYPDRNVRGPGIVLVRPGKGKLLLVGDTGSWTGNMARPWSENERVLKQMFRYLKPDKGVVPANYPVGRQLEYEVTVAGLQAIPVDNTLKEIERPEYKIFSPREKTDMPYIEAYATLKLAAKEQTPSRAFKMEAAIENFRWFDKPSKEDKTQIVDFTISRQGKVSDINAKGVHARWLASDLSVLSALLPVDGLSYGDRWESIEEMRIPALRGTDLPPVTRLNVEVVYTGDVEFEEKKCRLLMSSGELWLDDLGVKVEDLLPEEEVRRLGGTNYKFFSEHGGKFLFKREQWVDASTGIVVKARIQSRVLAWIQDTRKPVGISNAVKDSDMIVSLAHVTNFLLKKQQ